MAIVLVSSELPELTLLSDRILVLREGRPTALLAREQFSHETIFEYASPGGAVQPAFGETGDSQMKGMPHNRSGNFCCRRNSSGDWRFLYLVGIVSSPVNRKGLNIFLEPGNQSDVLRQVSNNGIIAVGMTLVILTGGIDLSVGSMMALGSVVCAMLLTEQGWTNASLLAIPVLAFVSFFLCAYLVPLIAINATKGAGKVGGKGESRLHVVRHRSWERFWR